MLIYLISFSIVTFCGMSFFRSRRSKNSNVETETIETLSKTRRQQMEARRPKIIANFYIEMFDQKLS